MLKLTDVKLTYLNDKAVTYFKVYELRNNAWVFDYADKVQGHWKKPVTIAKKHCAECGGKFNQNDWQF